MGIWQALLLGAVQGVTEFWPISSSAHVALLIVIFGWGEPDLSFVVALHIGTWIAVVWYYRRRLAGIVAAWWREVRGKEKGEPQAKLAWMLLLATLPGLVLGFIYAASSEMAQGLPPIMIFNLASFGLLLWAADTWGRQERTWQDVGWRDSLAIGMAQAIAIFPGVSRSGAAITTARAAGFKREDSADFAFLLSVPIIAAAGAYSILKLALEGMSGDMFWNMLVGGVAAALTGYFAVQFLLRHLGRGGYRPYAIYRLILAVLLVILYLTL